MAPSARTEHSAASSPSATARGRSKGSYNSWAIGRRTLIALDAVAAFVAALVVGGLLRVVSEAGVTAGLALLAFFPVAWISSVAAQGGYRSPGRQKFGVRARLLLQASVWLLAATMVISVVANSRTFALASLAVTGIMLVTSLTLGWTARAMHAARGRSGHVSTHRILAVGSPRSVHEYAQRVNDDSGHEGRVVAIATPRTDPSPPVWLASPRASRELPLPYPRETSESVADRVDGPPAAPGSVPLARSEAVADATVTSDFEDAADGSVVEPVSETALDLVTQAQRAGADEVVVLGGSDLTSTDYRDLTWMLEENGITLSVLPVTWDVAPHRVRIDHVSGLMPMVVRSRRDHPVGFRVKGLVDRVLAGIALLLALPVMAAIALAIRLDSPGSALFRQERVGRDGQVFTILKFRTMVTDAEAVKAALKSQNKHGAGVLFKMEKDPRITRVGGVLRKLSLDELPQLINVVTGQMSLVGPRPALPDEVAAYDERTQRRLSVKPGITGLWQVSGRSDLDWATSVDLDLRYIERWSVASDVSILARTVGAVVAGRGAY